MGKKSIYEVVIFFYDMLYFSANEFFQTCVYQISLLLLLIQDIHFIMYLTLKVKDLYITSN